MSIRAPDGAKNNNDLFAVCLIVRYAHTRLHKGGIEIAEINLRAW